MRIQERVKQRILYGLRYLGLTYHWYMERGDGCLLDIMKRKLQKMHINSVCTANRIWEEREQLGQVDQVRTMSDQRAEVIQLNPDKVEGLVEAEEVLIVESTGYETVVDSKNISTC